MNWVDFSVVLTVSVVLGLILFFGPIRRRIRNAHSGEEPVNKACPNCPMGYDKKAKRLVNDFKKAKALEKEEKKGE